MRRGRKRRMKERNEGGKEERKDNESKNDTSVITV